MAQLKLEKQLKSKSKPKQATTSTISDMADSRARFAAAAASSSQAEQQQQKPVESSDSEPFRLSTAATDKLLGVNRVVSARATEALSALHRAQCVHMMDMLMSGPAWPSHSMSLKDAEDELLATPSNLLTPELRELKLGFESMALIPDAWRDIERRVNLALRAEGEPELPMRDRHDLNPPVCILVTAKDAEDHKRQMNARIRDLAVRKPELFKTICELWAKGEAYKKREREEKKDGSSSK